MHDWQARLGFGPGGPTRHVPRQADHVPPEWWPGGRATTFNTSCGASGTASARRAIDFATRNADNVLGWCTLAMVQDRCPHRDAWKSRGRRLGRLAEKSGMRYPALYEQARCLGNAGLGGRGPDEVPGTVRRRPRRGRPAAARFLLPVRARRREGGHWAKLMRETAAKCAEKKTRPVIVTLAWQCYQLGDTAMADTLLDQALARSRRGEGVHRHRGGALPERDEPV